MRRSRSNSASSDDHLFIIEPIEPRLLLSADISPLAGIAIVDGLHKLADAANTLDASAALNVSAPVVNRTLGQLAALGDPVGQIQLAASNYFSGNNSATIDGLASALKAIDPAHVTTSTSVNGNVDLVNVTLTSSSTAGLVFDLSATAGGHTFSGPSGQNGSETLDSHTTTLIFGADTSTNSFLLKSADLGANVEVKASQVTGSAVVDGAAASVTSGSADVIANVSAHIADPQGGNLTASQLAAVTTQNVSTLAQTSISGTASLDAHISPADLTVPKAVSMHWDNVGQPTVGTFSSTPISAAKIQSGSGQAPTASLLFGEINTAIDAASNALSTVASGLKAASVLGSDLPFVGNQLTNLDILGPAIAQFNNLKATLQQDLADNTVLLTKIRSDIVALLSTAGLLPDATPANDVNLYVVENGATVKVVDGSSDNLTQVSQIELDLKLGKTMTTSTPVGTDLGLPGLGLTVNPGSTINGSVAWTFNFGIGFKANTTYLVSGDPSNNGSPLNLNVSYTLGDGFGAIGKMGFLEALLTEKSGPNHTGLSGSIGLALGGSGSMAALNHGTEIDGSNAATVTVTPTFKLNAHSNLGLAFGGGFQKDSNGNYVDKSAFPSLKGDFAFDWNIDANSLANAAKPVVGINNIGLDVGGAITTFLLPIIKPFYDATHGMKDVIDFLTSPVPIISDFLKLGLLPEIAVKQFLPTYTSGETLDWLHFSLDMLVDQGSTISADEARAIAPIAEAVFSIIKQLDGFYADGQATAGMGLVISLGNLNFSTKDLRLPQVNVSSDADLAKLGDAVGNFAGLGSGGASDLNVDATIKSLGTLLPKGPVADLVNGAAQIAKVAQDAYGAINDATNALNDAIAAVPGAGNDAKITQRSRADVQFPFFDDPSSILGLLFGQQVTFVNVDLGFGASVAFKPTIAAISFFGILTASLNLDVAVDADIGLNFGYDSTGLLELLNGADPSKLLDGIYIGPDPLLPGSSDVLKLDAKFGLGIDASVLSGLASVGLEGGLKLNFDAALTASTPQNPRVHFPQIVDSQPNESLGQIGPLSLTADGYAYLDFVYSSFWGLGPSGTDNITNLPIFHYPSVKPQDLGPLGLYDSHSQGLSLYMGGQSVLRTQALAKLGVPTGDSQSNSQSAADILKAESETYDIYINGDNTVRIEYVASDGKTYTQTPSGPVDTITADTGAGNDIIRVHNLAPNSVKVNFTASGTSVLYDPNATTGPNGQKLTYAKDANGNLIKDANGNPELLDSNGNVVPLGPAGPLTPVGGSAYFTSGGGSAVLTGADGNDTLIGGPSADVIKGGAGNDTIVSNGGNDFIDGGDGNDTITAGAGNQTILGGNGDDVIIAGGPGTSTYDGGAGSNTVDYSGQTAGINFNQLTGVATGASIGTETVSNFHTIIGTNFSDSITADNLGDVIKGLAGNDTLTGGTGNDTIIGGDGNNMIDGRAGNDVLSSGLGASTLLGGDGNDRITGGSGGDTIDGGTGDDIIVGASPTNPAYTGNHITGGDGNDNITGGNGHDFIYGNAGNDIIHGGDGGSYIDGGTGDNQIFAGAGADTILAADGVNLIYGGGSADTITVGNGQNTIYGNDGDDIIVAGNGPNTIDGGAGNDKITAGNGNNTIYGNIGDDIIQVGDGQNTVYGGDGNDTITAGNGNNLLIDGGAGNDHIVVGKGNNALITGGDGDDYIFAGDGINRILGGTGNDTIIAGNGGNYVDGGTGDDVIQTGSGADVIYGGDGNDQINAGDGKNIVDGGTGNDTITTGAGDDTIFGGAGDDIIVAGDGHNVIDAGSGNNTVTGGAGVDQIVAGDGTNTIDGAGGNDTIVVGDGNNTITGGAGDDSIRAGNGNNTIHGGDGNDTIVTGSGTNLIFGDAGNDWIDGGAGQVTVSGGDGNDTIYGGARGGLLMGDGGDDTIVASAGTNLIIGGDGNDTITGGAGTDTIYGGLGDNLLSATRGTDTIYGDNAGLAFSLSATGVLTTTAAAPSGVVSNDRNVIRGGSGADRLYGGAGSDTIIGGPGTKLIVGGGLSTYIQGGSGAGVTINGGNGGDTIIGSDGGGDIIKGGSGADRIELRGAGNTVNGGAGDDVIVGGAGNDILEGGAGNDLLTSSAASDTLYGYAANPAGDDHATDRLFPNGSVSGDSLSSPTSIATTPSVALPSDTTPQGWWSALVGPNGIALGGSHGNAASPVIAADAAGPWLAWTEINNGVTGLYVAHDVGGSWQGVAGSATGNGLALAGSSASNPSIAIVGGRPVVAWTAITAGGSSIEAATYDSSANGGAGAWVSLGTSNTPAGLSGIGAVDNAHVLATSSGPVVVWRDLSGATPHLYARRFDGANWVELGAGSASGNGIAGTLAVPSDFAVASDGTRVAVAFSVATPIGSALQAFEYSGASWQALASPNAADTPTDSSSSTSPSLAYQGGKLFLAWTQHDQSTGYLPRIFVKSESAGVWTSAGAGAASGSGVAPGDSFAGQPLLVGSGSTLRLVWTATVDTASGESNYLHTLSWNGTAFAADRPSDITGTGIGQLAGPARSASLALDPSGRPYLATDTAGANGVTVRAGLTSAAHVFVADSQTSIASILGNGTIASGDLILVTATTADTDLTLGAAAAGITIAGQDGVVFAHGITINGATGITIRNLDIAGPVTVTNTAQVKFAENTFRSTVTLNQATALLMRDNHLLAATTGLVVSGASQGSIHDNSFAGSATALAINASFSGLISANDITAAGTAVAYAAGAALAGNRIHGATVGVATSVLDPNSLFGAFAGSGSNDIFQNTTGVVLTNAQVIGQHIFANTIGLSGSGVIGGTVAADVNLINYNQTGISGFSGLVRFDRIESNGIGIAASNGLRIFDSQFIANTTAAIQASGVGNVEIAGNTIHSLTGDGVRLVNSAYNVELISNIIWTDSGIGINVANNSQAGFWSDYNTLFATGSGQIVYWTKGFKDILDWQDDVARFDLHSDGVTIVHPGWAEPHFAPDALGFLTTRPLVAGQRLSDPTTDGGDPAGSFIGYKGVSNLLTNGDFENGLTGWTVTAGGATVTPGLVAWSGQSTFQSGPAANAVAQQNVDLLAAGYSANDIDSGSLKLAFGGRVAPLTSSVSAQISIVFRDGANNAIGDAVVVPAGADLGRWLRVFSTVYIPAGARTAQFLFGVSKSDGSQGALLDAAYLAVVPRGAGQDQGVRTAADNISGDSTLGRLALRSPDLYADLTVNKPLFITWDSYGAAANNPVKIELWQDGPNGPQFLATIAASAPDTGRFAWTPSASGLTAGTHGLRIQISSVAHPTIYDRSTETFTVPEAGTTYYVDAVSGANRNDGKVANAPKASPVNLFRTYDIGAGSVVNIAAGDYALIDTLQLSGTTDHGFGLDTGFTINGASNGVSRLFPAIPGATPQALIDLTGASFVSLNYLTLQGGTDAVRTSAGSDNFSASYLTATGQSGDAFSITTNSPTGTLSHLSASGAGGAGLNFNGTLASITFFNGTNDHDGIIANGSVGQISDSTISGSGTFGYGLYLTLTGSSKVEANLISGTYYGVRLSGAGIVFGNADLSLNRGNVITGSTNQALFVDYATVVGNSIHDNSGPYYQASVTLRYSASATNNLFYANQNGVEIDNNVLFSGNRVFDNAGFGVLLSGTTGNIRQNVFYSNGVSIQVNSGSGTLISNNVIYGDKFAGVRLSSATNASIINNTFYEPTAGTISDPSNPNYGSAAISIDGTSTGASLTNNIIVALAGVGIRVSDLSQAGFVSDYNLFQTGAGGRVGTWIGSDRTSLSQWRTATGRDAKSRFGDPKFVSPTGADGVLGYGSALANGSDDDFHVQSQQGSYHSGSLAVIVGPNGLPKLPTANLTVDASSSPAIDRGSPATPIGSEPAPNGGIVEIGAYGGTSQASLSPATFITVTSPDGGETLVQGTSATITWNSFNVAGTVDISASSDGVNFTSIAPGVANSGSYVWTVDAAKFAAGSTYVVKIASTATPSLFDVSDGTFSISGPTHVYYVNDGSQTGDQYTTAIGDDANSGLSPDKPMASLAALLAKYALGAGDTVYVDTGTYNLTNNIVFTSADSGTGEGVQRLTIQGPTNNGVTATFNRQSASSGFYDFEFKGASYVTLANLHVTGGQWGIYLDDNSASKNITISASQIDGNTNGVYDGAGDDNFILTGSTLTSPGNTVGVSYATNALIVNDKVDTTGRSVAIAVDHATSPIIRNVTVTAAPYGADGIDLSWSTNVLVEQSSLSKLDYHGIYGYRTSGIIQNNIVDATGATHGIEIGGYNGTLQAIGNTVFGQSPGNAYGGGIIVDDQGDASNNIVYGSDIGFRLSGIAVAENNRVFNNALGMLVGYQSTARGNKVYDNVTGIIAESSGATVSNNVVYDNTSVGIQAKQYSTTTNVEILNNTVVQTTGTAINLLDGSTGTDIRDNIISVASGAIGLAATVASENGVRSDYNLWNIKAGGTLANWGGVSVATLFGWKTDIGLDTHSLGGDPLFVNPAGTDGIRGYVAGVDHGADDDFSLQLNSPAINRGDLAQTFFSEPLGAGGNGDRRDIGAAGGTSAANVVPAQTVQLLGSTGDERFQVGRQTTLSFRSTGLSGEDPVLFINSVGGAISGSETWNNWIADTYRIGTAANYNTTTAIDPNGLDVPQAILQSMLVATSSNALDIKYQIPLSDGSYRVTLIFADNQATSVGQRTFDIKANGTTFASGFDVFRSAGGANKATSYSFDVNASAGGGLSLDLAPKINYAILSGIQITRITPVAKPWTASLDVSTDNGTTWSNVASGLTLDRFGAGTFNWTPTAATSGFSGLLRVTATDGTNTVTNMSAAPFMVAPAGNAYYVNDGSTAGDVYTTAVGNDANSGKTAADPMASLAALLNVYQLKAGDIVYVDSGTYNIPTQITFNAQDSGVSGNPVRIVGAGNGQTVFDRGSTASGTAVFRFSGGHDISVEGLTLKRGETTVDITSPGSVDIALKNDDISGYSSIGINVGAGNSGFTLTGSKIHDVSLGSTYGVYIYNGSNDLISGNTFANLAATYPFAYGISASSSLGPVTISGNTFINVGYAIAATVGYMPTPLTALTVTSNVISGGNQGIYLSDSYGISLIQGNTITGSSGFGIDGDGARTKVDHNETGNDTIGIEVSGNAVATNNNVHDNSNTGIQGVGSNGALASGNLIKNNGIGVSQNIYTVANNILVGNAIGIDVASTYQSILNNTFDQASGIAIRFRQNSSSYTFDIENNIIRMSGGTVFDADAVHQTGITSDWNLFSLSGAATLANWAGLSVSDLNAWRFGTGFDAHSLSADPLFTDAANGNYKLQAGSPGIDRGNPTSRFDNEPGNNGGRINLGYEGNTANATQSGAQTVQVLSPDGYEKLQQGVATTIAFRTDGIVGVQPILAINDGGSGIAGSNPGTNWTGVTSLPTAYNASTTQTIDTSGSPLAGPASLYQSELYNNNYAAGAKLTQSVAIGDGTYTVNLHFVEYSALAANNPRKFDIRINGVLVATDFNIQALAGNQIDKAVVASFQVTASGGTGITIELTNKTAGNPATLAGIEIEQATASTAVKTAKVEVSPDNGQTWQLVADNVALDRLGNGSVAWTPGFITNGNVALVRVTAGGVSAVSEHGFLVANSGHDYFINDGSTVGDEYTSAVGNDLNSGKTPDAPMASLAALVRAYALGPGDTVHIDTGSYKLLSDVVLGQGDSGDADAVGHRLTFQGPTGAGHVATIDRANAYGYNFDFTGGDFVTLANLSLTGGNIGVLVTTNTASNGIDLSHLDISSSAAYGIYAGSGNTGVAIDSVRVFGAPVNASPTGILIAEAGSITNSEVFGQYVGIEVYNASGVLVDNNSVHDNRTYGILAYGGSGTGAATTTVSNNRVFNNATQGNYYGIYASGSNLIISGNHVFGQTTAGDAGIFVNSSVLATGNDVYGNYDGISVYDLSSIVRGNRIFSNSNNGITANYYGGTIVGNRIYSNKTGIKSSLYGGSIDIEENLIYANTTSGVELSYGNGSKLISNTIWQSVGTDVKLSGSASNFSLSDDIVWSDLGTMISIAADSQSGFKATNNLYWRGSSSAATLVAWGATNYSSLAAWQAGVPALNSGSLEGDPKFIDIDGADNVLGGLDTALGGGADDNFTPGKFSPAIDSGNAFVTGATDFLGQTRHDDPAVANTGTGPAVYDETSGGASVLAAGTAVSPINYYAASYATINLPFAFNFYGKSYSTIYASPAGFIAFTPGVTGGDAYTPSLATLKANAMIAPFWAAMDNRFGTGNIYVESAADHVTIRFVSEAFAGPGSTLSQASVRLGADGSVRFDYGNNLNGFTPVIGLSSGDGADYAVASISGRTDLNNANAVILTPNQAEGRVYYDIGAIEFQGSSSDVVPPTILSGANLPANGASTDAVFTSINLNFSETLDVTSANSNANFQLIEAGADGKFDTPDDRIVAIVPSYASASKVVQLSLSNGPLADGFYRLTVSKASGLLDSAGNALDGDGDGAAGGAFVRSFHIDRSANHAPVVLDATASVANDQTLAVTLHATDADNDPITFAIVTAPKHGTIQNFDPVAGTFTYVPNYGYVGSDTIRYAANDPKLGHSEANFVVNVTPINHAPIASDLSANVIAGQPTTIVLQGSDLETAANQLTLLILSQPAHGTVSITGQNTVSYTASAAYQGSDSFTYAWRDNGAPAGNSSNVLTSQPATVSLAVTKISHAPATAATTISLVENAGYTFKVADFPFSDPNDSPANAIKAVVVVTLPSAGVLTNNGVAVTAGQSILATDIAAGKLVFTPAAGGFGIGYASFNFEVQDDGGTANGGLDISAVATATLNVARINNAPTTSGFTVQLFQGGQKVFTSADFPFGDPGDVPADSLKSVVITTLPVAGSLTFAGNSVVANQAISKADLDAGKLVYTPGAGSGAAYASFGFEVVDTGGTANGGHDTSTAATVTVSVGAINHAPVTSDVTVSTNEGAAYIFKTADFAFSDPNDTPANALKSVLITSLPTLGTLSLNGTAVTASQAIAAADIAAGKLCSPPRTGPRASPARLVFCRCETGRTPPVSHA
ncbi:LEPR-XLL domain-containing protein, partial [Bradyrhizobium sp. INPA01-394B]|uniref:right-handed parallel beta-helix repeat-containing protein n=1 Tax=Bradyrhizobium campsiandrae TaxID=1729892 RepID=UPI00165FB139